MKASRSIAMWMAVGALGVAGMGAGCSGDEPGDTTGSSTTTSATTSAQSSSGGGAGGSGGTGGGGSDGAGGTGGGGSDGAGGTGGGGSDGAGGTSGGGSDGAGGMMGQRFDFTMHGTNYTAFPGRLVYLTGVASGEAIPTLADSATISDEGSFTVTGQLIGGKSYTVHWYVDINDNGVCDPFPTDRVWMEDIPTVTADVTSNVQYNADFGTCP